LQQKGILCNMVALASSAAIVTAAIRAGALKSPANISVHMRTAARSSPPEMPRKLSACWLLDMEN
jgi:hypothetical protein